MNIKLIAHTALAEKFVEYLQDNDGPHWEPVTSDRKVNHRAAVALTAIRTCYSPNKPTEIVALEGDKYFGQQAKDGEGGTEADRLFRHIIRSGHASTLEHITYTFAIEGVSRSLLAQLTRHRHFSFSVQSQRYVKFGSDDKSGGFENVTPPSIAGSRNKVDSTALGTDTHASVTPGEIFEEATNAAQYFYDRLREAGIPAEDARFVLPNAAACNLVMTGNLRSILEFYGKRRRGKGAQWEIAELAERIREEIIEVDEWLKPFFGEEAK